MKWLKNLAFIKNSNIFSFLKYPFISMVATLYLTANTPAPNSISLYSANKVYTTLNNKEQIDKNSFIKLYNKYLNKFSAPKKELLKKIEESNFFNNENNTATFRISTLIFIDWLNEEKAKILNKKVNNLIKHKPAMLKKFIEGYAKDVNMEKIIKTNTQILKIGEKINFPIKKEYKVNKISEVKKICANVAEDIDGWKYMIKLPTSLYQKYEYDIINNFPNNVWCTFLVATRDKKTSPVTNIIYTSAFWDTDASDIVAQETAEAENAKKEVEQAKKEVEQAKKEAEQIWKRVKAKEQQVKKLEQMVKEKGYLGYLQDNIIYLLKHDNKKEAISILEKVNKELKLRNLKWNKYAEGIKDGLETIKLKYGNDKEINNLVDKILEKLNLN